MAADDTSAEISSELMAVLIHLHRVGARMKRVRRAVEVPALAPPSLEVAAKLRISREEIRRLDLMVDWIAEAITARLASAGERADADRRRRRP